ncbi:MAG: phenylalanine--tRNA ligase subunit beta [Bacteroidetes bacterium]|nr:phenylalanine--tRNA ligase subunit beta [Bacteroidota bacterium]
MKISYNWLNEILENNYSPNNLSEILTSIGLEVESIEDFESVKGGLKGLVIGMVVECVKHPDADKLKLTKVDVGNEKILEIVCGAPNVEVGQKVVVATVGTKLYPKNGECFEIKKSKIRGALSEGMLCADDEIGIGTSHDGIIVLPESAIIGQALSEFYNLKTDNVFEIGLTPNRSDAASHIGVARDIVAYHNSINNDNPISIKLNNLQILPDASNINSVDIKVENIELCPRYAGMIISGITVSESPEWLKNKLNAIGVKPINNIVDVTNYVLHHLGQPLHAFDVDEIEGKQIKVRLANEKEKIITLDGVERELNAFDLIIADSEKPLCIAGVFGGKTSGVTEKTTSVFIESAFFEASTVRKTSKHHSLKTDASFRFERGTDPEMVVTALTMAANLILDIAGGAISMAINDNYPNTFEPHKVAFSFENCNNLIGKTIDKTIVKTILINLGIVIENEGNDALLLNIPRYKTDVTREADVIEEVMRIYGYNNVEVSKSISYTSFNDKYNYELKTQNDISSLLVSFGFFEMMNLSLTSDKFYTNEEALVKVVNPLSSDLNVLRQNMIHSGLETIAYNINRKNNDLKLFEFGKTYEPSNNDKFPYIEFKQLSLFTTGEAISANTKGFKIQSDIFLLKNVITQILNKCGINDFKTDVSENKNFDYGINILHNNKIIAQIGKASKSTSKAHQIDVPVFMGLINLDLLVKAKSKQKIVFNELSKFPTVKRDLALVLDKSVKYEQLKELALTTEKKLLTDVNIFDIYEGDKLGDKKSYALSYLLQNKEATLTDKQIDAVMEKILNVYKEKVGAELR